MNIPIKPEKINSNKAFKNSLKNALTLKRAPTSFYNNHIYQRATTISKFDIEKAHY